jgi:hypothetical protein
MEWCNQPTLSILDLQNQKVYKISEIYHHYYDLTSNTKWSSQDLSKIQSHIRNQNENHYCVLTNNLKHFPRPLTCTQSKCLDQIYEEYGIVQHGNQARTTTRYKSVTATKWAVLQNKGQGRERNWFLSGEVGIQGGDWVRISPVMADTEVKVQIPVCHLVGRSVPIITIVLSSYKPQKMVPFLVAKCHKPAGKVLMLY